MTIQNLKIFTINNKREKNFLRQKTAEFDFSGHTKKDIDELIKKMKTIMLGASGIGLSANQIGLNLKMFISRVPKIKDGKIAGYKFYAVFNPEIAAASKKTAAEEEGCLSIPGIYGEVKRPERIALKGRDRYGKKIAIKADGLLARVFQHEVDHLNGILFIDKCKNVYAVEKSKIRNPKSETNLND